MSKLSYVASLAIEVIKEAYPNDQSYIDKKIHQFTGRNNHDALRFLLSNFDSENKKQFAQKIGVHPISLEHTHAVLQKL